MIEKTDSGMPYFVIFPQFILDDLWTGKITASEYITYGYIRHQGDIKGVASISLDDIAENLFEGRLEINTINKILIKLKKKKYIYYEERRGKKGKYRIEFDYWILANKQVKRLKWDQIEKKEAEEAKSNPRSGDNNQRLKEVKAEIRAKLYKNNDQQPIRCDHTDTDKDIDKDKENERENSKPFKTVINGDS